MFLLVLSTTSFANTICVDRLPNVKNYATFMSDDSTALATCEYKNGKYVCCADIDAGDKLRVVFTSLDNKLVTVDYDVIKGNNWSKTINGKSVSITIEGEDGNYLVIEEFPKEMVEDADEILSEDKMVLEFDPTVAWFVTVKDGRGYLSYRVRRGSPSLSSPIVKLSSCNLEINHLSTKQLREGGDTYIIHTFEVLLDGKRVVPSNVVATLNGNNVEVRYTKDSKLFEIISRVESFPVEITVEVRSGECSTKSSTTVYGSEEGIPLYFIVLLVGGVIVLGWLYLRQAR